VLAVDEVEDVLLVLDVELVLDVAEVLLVELVLDVDAVLLVADVELVLAVAEVEAVEEVELVLEVLGVESSFLLHEYTTITNTANAKMLVRVRFFIIVFLMQNKKSSLPCRKKYVK
jgi:hypothetical protein